MELNRRQFMKGAGAAAAVAAVAGLAGCSPAGGSDAGSDAGEPSAEKVDWLGTAPEIAESDVVETVETDVVVLGAAVAGSFSAYGAQKAGAEVIVLEKNFTAHYGGSGMSFVDSKVHRDAGAQEYDKNQLLYDLVNSMQRRCDPSLVGLWVYQSGEILDSIVEDICIPYDLPYSYSLGTPDSAGEISQYCATQIFLGDPNIDVIKPVLETVHQYLEDNGVEIKYNTAGVKLLQEDDGSITGVYATNENGEYVLYKARKGVIVCTGAYGSDDAMVDYFLSPGVAKAFHDINGYTGKLDPADVADFPIDTGDGQKMMCWAGAKMEDPTHAYNGWVSSGIISAPHLNVAQVSGRRFQNEAITFLDQFQSLVEQPLDEGYFYWQVYDKDGLEKMPMLLGLPSEQAAIFAEATVSVEADTIEDLAKQMNVDVDNFKATIDRYNELCEAGFDEDFGKLPEYMMAIKNPPFTAGKCQYTLACTLSGVCCDNQLRVLDSIGVPIKGLYAAGNTVGRRFGWAYEGTHVGLTNAMAITHGVLAGRNVAAL